jgi:hypothetical protein
VISANLPDDAECTQASVPATRNPVSLKCATGAAASSARITSKQAPSFPVILLTIPATAPGDTGTPNNSPIASQVRCRDTNCPCHRYAHTATIRGPYCTGAATPAGASPAVTLPHPQQRDTIRCSVTSAVIRSGRSTTWRFSVLVTAAPNKPAPQPTHRPGSCQTTSSGRPAISSVAPGCPFGRPGLRPVFLRSDFGAGLASPSADGGLEEFREFWPSRARRSATSAASATTCARSASSCA